jgi:hypothetical protein
MDLIYSSCPKGARVVFANVDIAEGFLWFLLTESFASRIVDMPKTNALSFHPTWITFPDLVGNTFKVPYRSLSPLLLFFKSINSVITLELV